jgi:zinc transport system substrate-binding protein
MIPLKKFNLTLALLISLLSFTTNSMADELQGISSNTETNNDIGLDAISPIVITPIVVTIKPLYSLVAHITDGVQVPELLVKQPPSSHHYQLRPSERRLLASAKLVIWIGPEMETYLTRVIQTEKNSDDERKQIITAMHSSGLKLHSKRTNQHQQKITHSEPISNRQNIDPHIWLSAHNAAAISKHIARSLISIDPQNAALYKKNLQQLLAKIEDTERWIKFTLNSKLDNKPVQNQQAFISYHDAFQYYDREYQLNHIDSISYDEESGPSLKHIRQIKKLISENNIYCLVYQPPKPAIVDSLTTRTHIQATALDPMGLNTSNSKDAWFELMQQITEGFEQCLNL